MIPILFENYETSFITNGIGRLADCISCAVTEERNGIYECQFTYPVTGEMFSQIREGRIIGVIHDDTKDIQPFDIYAHSAPLNGVVTFYAHHISYRLGNVILKPMQASSCAAVFAAIPSNTYNNCPFTFWTDKAVSQNWKNEIPSAVKAILGGQEGSILDVYGKGDYQWDKWVVRLYTNRGNDNGVSIRYGVNLTDLEQEYDESGSYNAVAPYWVSSEDGTVVTLTNGIVAVSSGTRLVPWTTQSGTEVTDNAANIIHFEVGNPITPVPMDLSEAFEEQPTEAQLEAEALRRLNNSEAWLPSENIKVEFVNLADTEEYRNVAALQRVSLCDKVSVYCGPLGVSAVKMQVIRVVYNVLTERYDEIELGKAKVSFAQTITAKIEEVTKDLPTVSMMQRAIDNATDQITGAKGGHLLDIYDANGNRQEMVIMDTEDIGTAVKVWRWNLGGLGYSKNGYSGPYGLAITQDGAIVADFITTGTLIANIIKAGILSDASRKNFWNMETGEFSLAAATTIGGSTVETIAQNEANSAVNTFDNNLNQQSVFNRLTNNGQTQGIYLNNGLLYINANYINSGIVKAQYIDGDNLHVKAANIDGTLTIGQLPSDVATEGEVTTISENTVKTTNVTAQNLKVNAANITGTLTIGQLPGTVAEMSDIPTKVSELTNDSGFQNATQVTTITNNTISTTNVVAQNLHVKAANVDDTFTANKIVGGTLTLGGNNNTNGTLTVKDAANKDIGTWDNNGLTLNKGSIYGPSITLGGNYTNSITVLDGLKETVGYWDKDNFYIVCPNGEWTKSIKMSTFYGNIGFYRGENESLVATVGVEELLYLGKYIFSINAFNGGAKLEFWNDHISCYGDFRQATGTKSRVVNADQYSDRLLYCYETPTPMFGDIGDGVISDDGFCYVMLDAVFAQTITTDQYQVFLQKYGPGDCWVRERNGAYFIVEGTPGLSFGWEVKAKQRDYDQLRLERNDEKFTVPTQTYGEDAAKHINYIQKERISA